MSRPGDRAHAPMDPNRTKRAANAGPVPRLGATLTELLYDAERAYGTIDAFTRPTDDGWDTISLTAFRQRAERWARGLVALGLKTGDRVALFMDSDTDFCIADYACLIAGMPNVPLYLTQTPESVRYIIEHSAARVLFVSDSDRLSQVLPALGDTGGPETIVVVRTAAAPLPAVDGRQVMSAHELVTLSGPDTADATHAAPTCRPGDLATIIYTSGTTGQPKGVMLSHENLSFNALHAFDTLTGYQSGADGEVVLSFLPMSHVFARTLVYGAIAHGSPIRFSSPDRLTADLRIHRPTVLATVPRVLEKVYASICTKTESARGLKGAVARWGLAKARSWREDRDLARRSARLADRLADRLVFERWREAFGGRLRYLPVGGAALDARLARVFAAAGFHVLEGYGLTETSPVISVNRPGSIRPGWVGRPLPHVEVRIDEDGEICTRGPHVMLGYYRQPELTREVIDRDGWFHTGDIGRLSDDGYLQITDRKKSLFKLSTGKYVTPQPLENRLGAHPLVDQAVVVGNGRSFAGALVFPMEPAIRHMASALGLADDLPVSGILGHEVIRTHFADVVAEANEGVDPWVAIKRFSLVAESVSVENGLLTPTLKIRRSKVEERFSETIAGMYGDDFLEPARRSSGSARDSILSTSNA